VTRKAITSQDGCSSMEIPITRPNLNVEPMARV
jgi:hypothetical protein